MTLSGTDELREDPLLDEIPATGPPPRRGVKWGTIVLFSILVLFGLGCVLSLVPLATRFNGLLVAALVLFGPVVLIATVLGVWRAFSKFAVLRKKLRWWHFLWFALLASGFVFRVREANAARDAPVDSAAMYRLALVAFAGLVMVWRLLRRQTAWFSPLFQGLIGAMTCFALACATSSLWSVNPPWTLYKSVEYLVDLVLLAGILVTLRSARDYEALFDWNWTLTGLLIASAWVGAVIWPEEGLYAGYSGGILGARLQGVFPGQGSNRLGDLGAILGVVCIARLLPVNKRKFDKLWYLLVLALGFLTIVLSQTRSALLAMGLATLIIMAVTGRLKRGALVVLSLLGLVAVSGLGKLVMSFLQRGQSTEEMASLSDRLKWWSMGWQLLSQHPWTGLGAFAAGPFGVFEKLGMNSVGPLHSDYVETLVGTSFWGLIPLVVALCWTWWVLLRSIRDKATPAADRQLIVESIAVLTVITIRSVFMTFIVMHPPLNFLVVMGYAERLRRRRKRAVETQRVAEGMVAA